MRAIVPREFFLSKDIPRERGYMRVRLQINIRYNATITEQLGIW